MRTKWIVFGIIMLVLVLVFGSILTLGGNDDASEMTADMGNVQPISLDLPPMAPDDVNGNTIPVNQPAANPSNQERLIIQNATLYFTVENVTAKIADIRDIAAQHQGWVVGSNTSTRIAYEDVTYGSGSIAIRVPSDQFEAVLATIKVVGVIQVNSENITGEDVTERYVDLNSRLRSKQTSYNQLAILMESATDVTDVLAVQTELERFQTDIEVLEGQIRFLEESAAYSLITVDLSEEVPQRPVDEGEDTDSWKPLQTAEDAFGALLDMLQALGDVLIVFVIFALPLAIVIGVPAWVMYRVVRPRLQSDVLSKADE